MGSVIAIVIGFGALSVDISLITMAKLQAQATADGASHAALVVFQKTQNSSIAINAAQYIADHDQVAMGLGKIRTGDPQFGTWDFQAPLGFEGFLGIPSGGNLKDANAVRVHIERNAASSNAVDLLLAPVLGIPTADVEAESIAAHEQRAIMLVNDMSCSMMEDDSGRPTNFATDALRSANVAFLQFLLNQPAVGDQLGLAIFAKFGSKPATTAPPVATDNFANAPWIPLQLIVPVDVVSPAFNAGFNGICNTERATSSCGTSDPYPRLADIGGCTNPEVAIRQAIHELTTKTGAPYFRGILFESDGLPNCGTDSGFGSFDEADAKARAQAAANDAFAADISIWTVLFHNGDFDPQFMKDMTRGIGFFQDSADAAKLPLLFEEVAQSLPTAFVF